MQKIKQGSTGNVLIVDDEEMVRQLLNRILTDSGYHCCMASNAAEARIWLKQIPFIPPRKSAVESDRG
jgi:DNA-binding NtrC family response regulator